MSEPKEAYIAEDRWVVWKYWTQNGGTKIYYNIQNQIVYNKVIDQK
jgi:hypothetical protein